MRIVNTEFETITEYDSDNGRLVPNRAVREDAEHIDNIIKFAWSDDDFEDVLMYIPNHVDPDTGPSTQDDTDSMLVDLEYRLTLLELGVTE